MTEATEKKLTRRELELKVGADALAKRQHSLRSERKDLEKTAGGTDAPKTQTDKQVADQVAQLNPPPGINPGAGVDPSLVNRNPANNPDQALVATSNNDPNSGLEGSQVNVVDRHPVAQTFQNGDTFVNPDAGTRVNEDTTGTGPTASDAGSPAKQDEALDAQKIVEDANRANAEAAARAIAKQEARDKLAAERRRIEQAEAVERAKKEAEEAAAKAKTDEAKTDEAKDEKKADAKKTATKAPAKKADEKKADAKKDDIDSLLD